MAAAREENTKLCEERNVMERKNEARARESEEVNISRLEEIEGLKYLLEKQGKALEEAERTREERERAVSEDVAALRAELERVAHNLNSAETHIEKKEAEEQKMIAESEDLRAEVLTLKQTHEEYKKALTAKSREIEVVRFDAQKHKAFFAQEIAELKEEMRKRRSQIGELHSTL